MDSRYRRQLVRTLADSAARHDWSRLVAEHGTPLLVFDPAAVGDVICELRSLMPDIDWHFAVKCQSHREMLSVLRDHSAAFDLASRSEVTLAVTSGIAPDRCIVTNPHLTRSDVEYAVAAGIRTFVVDSEEQIERFAALPVVPELLVRFAPPDTGDAAIPAAHLDLSAKFGVTPDEVVALVKRILAVGARPGGVSFHVGSQCVHPAAFSVAIGTALEIVDAVAAATGASMATIDIGGGFPVAYRAALPYSLADFAVAIDAAFGARRTDFRIIAEPGRVLAAPAMTLLSSVIGSTTRAGRRWHFLDDGIYGTYSNILTERIWPAILAGAELFDGVDAVTPVVLAGPTCDSTDVIVVDHPMPPMAAGELVISPMMGAYTTVTASAFNGFGAARVVTVRH
ncbi:type III PLP-dependent enzyme [Gordonia sp. NPDC003950]